MMPLNRKISNKSPKKNESQPKLWTQNSIASNSILRHTQSQFFESISEILDEKQCIYESETPVQKVIVIITFVKCNDRENFKALWLKLFMNHQLIKKMLK